MIPEIPETLDVDLCFAGDIDGNIYIYIYIYIYIRGLNYHVVVEHDLECSIGLLLQFYVTWQRRNFNSYLQQIVVDALIYGRWWGWLTTTRVVGWLGSSVDFGPWSRVEVDGGWATGGTGCGWDSRGPLGALGQLLDRGYSLHFVERDMCLGSAMGLGRIAQFCTQFYINQFIELYKYDMVYE
jgi:hypothetical protein